ncbi:hypothetical protein ACHAQA_005964 [Verticillium albo-atrum]
MDSTRTPRPTLIFVPGAWHTPEIWYKTTNLLQVREYACVRVTLPSTLGDSSATFADDVDAVRAAIVAEQDKGDVILIAHSYGGAVAASAIKDLNVRSLVLIASGFLPSGQSFLGAMGGTPPPQWKADTEGGWAVITVDARDMLYHDLPVEEGEQWVSKLTKQSLKALTEGGERAYAGWKDVPVWYLVTADDHALSVGLQREMVEVAKGQGTVITVNEIDSGHSPMLSRPEETVEFILEAAGAFTR